MKKYNRLWIVTLVGVLSISVYAKNQQQCEEQCYKNVDKMQYSTQSGATSKALDRCLEACAQLGSAQQEFKNCIAHAKSESDKEQCREDYRNNRPDI